MEQTVASPHVLLFPFPGQGNMNSMLNLAEFLCNAGLHITFLNSNHNQQRLLRFTNAQERFSRWPKFRFQTIPDGLPADHPRSAATFFEILDSMKATAKPLFREMMIMASRKESGLWPPLSCFIIDGLMPFAIDVAEELSIRVIVYRAISACCLWTFFCLPGLFAAAELPFQGGDVEDDMDVTIKNVPGMQGFLRRRDLPSFFQTKDPTDPIFQQIGVECQKMTQAYGLIINTFEDLESPVLTQFRSQVPNLYTVGPLHALTLRRQHSSSSMTSNIAVSNSLWDEDRSCITWLDSQPPKSVVYMSFGSLVVYDKDTLMEFWHGLVNSGKLFLWVVRQDSINISGGEGTSFLAEVVDGAKERGSLVVGWAPQEEVLSHPALGVFLTHSGWNSTMEGIYAGVPMICWPFFADQQINSRFVSEVWKVGVALDKCDRWTIERVVKDVMEQKREVLVESIDGLAKLARRCISEGGSSRSNLDRLIQDLRWSDTDDDEEEVE
ncbi:7-deoxyloganetic acid glucosyltransferase-like isoform X2 [Macadamia integrifolia]|uniref:7-deoxyloganetic acid glucosyltransferase-like isoform X2 n=1 Tax=Macadamia integrifolia TaxID=60698 RepID=UPI001C52CF72|nr:7-deoxyloganetic acid glucosyltransferase-like isoform X2 [Macadamia integrifolia]